jgi:GcrA cell cycle regulator
MTHITTWTAIAEQTLRLMWGKGASAAMIAAALHMTRGAVCGKLHRLKLNRPIVVVRKNMNHVPKPPRSKNIITAPLALATLPPVEASAGKPVPFLKAKSFHCRAVLDERGDDGLVMFCGGRKVHGSWCAKHYRRFVTLGRP